MSAPAPFDAASVATTMSDAVLGEPAPVAERDVVHVADAEAVDERHAGLNVVDDPRVAVDELDDACRSRP